MKTTEKSILVTGASGFIGRHTLPLLQKRGYRVYAIGGSVRTGPDIPGISWHGADLLEPQSANSLLKKIRPQYLLHFAWETRPGGYWTNDTNIAWAKASMDLFEKFYTWGGLRGVFAGSCAEYAWKKNGVYRETRSLQIPATLYGASKLGCANIIYRFALCHGHSFSWGRIFHTFGPFENRGRLVPSIITALLADSPMGLTRGRQRKDFLFVEDVAAAFIALLESGVEGPVNIASGKDVSIASLAQSIGDILGKTELLKFGELKIPAHEPRLLIADTSRLTLDVGFTPKYSIERAMKRTVDWWRKTTNEGTLRK